MKRYLVLFSLLLSFSPLSAQAQETGKGVPLSIQNAISLAIENNLTIKLAKAQTLASRGRVLEGASALLPQIIGTLSENRTYKLNLAAMGFQPGTLPGLPSAIGPFNVFDARFHLVENIFNLSSLKILAAARVGREAAIYEEELAKEQVAAAAALAYIDDLRSQQAIVTALANKKLARELLRLAQDKMNSGTADPIDLARAKTSLSQARMRVISANLAAQKSDMRLKHVIGVALGEPIILKEKLGDISRSRPDLKNSLSLAFLNRLEIKIESKKLENSKLNLSAIRYEAAPNISLSGDYGLSGITPTKDDIPTENLGAGLSWRFFTGGKITGRAREAQAQVNEVAAELDDTKVQVEQDVRSSLLDLTASEDEIQTSSQTEHLALLELDLAKNRFRAGIGDNQELVRAQDELANARDAQVEALAAQNNAWMSFFLGLGKAREFKF